MQTNVEQQSQKPQWHRDIQTLVMRAMQVAMVAQTEESMRELPPKVIMQVCAELALGFASVIIETAEAGIAAESMSTL